MRTTIMEKNLEKILSKLEKNDRQLKRLRRAKKRLFLNANEGTKDVLIKYEELETWEREIIIKEVYTKVVKSAIRKIKWLLTE